MWQRGNNPNNFNVWVLLPKSCQKNPSILYNPFRKLTIYLKVCDCRNICPCVTTLFKTKILNKLNSIKVSSKTKLEMLHFWSTYYLVRFRDVCFKDNLAFRWVATLSLFYFICSIILLESRSLKKVTKKIDNKIASKNILYVA